VLQFVTSQQNLDGGFKDRGGKSDLYYSLFGGMMLRAAEKETGDRRPKTEDRSSETGNGRMGKETHDDVDSDFSIQESRLKTQDSRFKIQDSNLIAESLLKFRFFIDGQSNSKVPGFIEKCCLVLLQKELKTRRSSRMITIISLGKSFWKERYSINLSYRSFVLFLTMDAVFPFPVIFKLAAKRTLARTIVDQHSPCSEVAAKVFLLKMMHQDGLKEQELLKLFASETGGFKAFLHLQQADMLSTSVALFALNYAGCDIRLLKPDCLDFIQSNYSDGAFLSGDGDQTADVEYTFYGLLALGVLAD
jgi:prenyltransferase beta subunit